MSVHPRTLVHGGTVLACGLLIEDSGAFTTVARHRVLESWRPGARIFRVERSLLLLWAEPRRVSAEQAPGAPVVRAGAVLTAVPLREPELRAFDPPAGALVVARGGELVAAPIGAEVDPASWIDAGAVTLERMVPFAPRNVSPIHVQKVASAEHVEGVLRAGVGEPGPDRASVAQAVLEAQQREVVRGGGDARRLPFLAAAVWTLLGVLSSLVSRGRGEGVGKRSGGLSVHRAAPTSPAAPLGPRLGTALRHLAAQLLLRLRLARIVGRWHAEYLARMIDLFERGELDDALRHAIPLGGLATGKASPAVLPPTPRASLALTAGRVGAGSALGLADELYETLRRRYRAAFEELDRRGDVERAAFVLAELLRVTPEAVAYLEKHRRYALAAELAEARELAPEYVVRLWFRAGEPRRAVALARRHGCFAIAVERLERDDVAAGFALRLAWADACASAGDYLGAAQVARKVPSAGGLVAGWIDQALEVGGATAATASVLRLEFEPGSFADARARLRAALGDPSPLGQPIRDALYEAIERSSAPAAATLAREAARGALLDGRGPARARIDGLLARAGDPVLRLHAAGARTLVRAALPAGDGGARHYALAADNASSVPVYDAALVAHDRLIVASGELGVRLFASDGRLVTRFDTPASALVVSPRGDRVLAVASRGTTLEVTRIDVVRRRAQRWGICEVSAFAREFDGATWVVARGAELLALDASASGFEATWRTVLGAGARAATDLEVTPGALLVVATSADASLTALEAFELPSLTLRRRRTVPLMDAGLGWSEQADGRCEYRALDPTLDAGPLLTSENEPLAEARALQREGAWCLSGRRPDGAVVVSSGTRRQGYVVKTSVCTFKSAGGASVGTRLQAGFLVAYARTGRLVLLDLTSGERIVDFAPSA